jgi:hypothetical protein
LVFANTPTLITPNIGVATATSLAASGTVTVASSAGSTAAGWGVYFDTTPGTEARMWSTGNGRIRVEASGTQMASFRGDGFYVSKVELGGLDAATSTPISQQSAGVLQIGSSVGSASGSLACANVTASGTVTLGTAKQLTINASGYTISDPENFRTAIELGSGNSPTFANLTTSGSGTFNGGAIVNAGTPGVSLAVNGRLVETGPAFTVSRHPNFGGGLIFSAGLAGSLGGVMYGAWTISSGGSLSIATGGTGNDLLRLSNVTAARQFNLGTTNTGNFVLRDATAGIDRLTVSPSGNVTIPGTGTHTFGTTNTVTITAGAISASQGTGTPTLNIANPGNSAPDACARIGTASAGLWVAGANYGVRATAGNAATVPFTARGFASQTANLQEWQNSAGTVLASVSASGDIAASGLLDLRKAATANILRFATNTFLRTDTSQLSIFDTGLGRNNISLWRGGNFVVGSSALIAACSNLDSTGGSVDTSLSRNTAGVWQMGTTVANASGSLLLSSLTASTDVKTNQITRNNSDATLSLGVSSLLTDFYNITVSSSLKNTSGIAGQIVINSTIDQNSFDAAGTTDFLINRTEDGLGTGAHNFADFQVGGVSRFSVSNTGNVTASGTVTASNISTGNLTASGTATLGTAKQLTINASGYIVSDPANFRTAISAVPTFDVTNADGENKFVVMNSLDGASLEFLSASIATNGWPQLGFGANTEEGFYAFQNTAAINATSSYASLSYAGYEFKLNPSGYTISDPANFRTAIGLGSGNSPTFAGLAASGKITGSASTTGFAPLNLPHGVAPTSPVNGDIWTTSSGAFVQINGATTQMQKAITSGTAAPSGGVDGDIYLQYV